MSRREAITVGNTTVTLPGIGSWLALAIERQDFRAIGEAVAMMAVVILLYDQLFFRPIVAWADRFRFEQTASNERPASGLWPVAPHGAAAVVRADCRDRPAAARARSGTRTRAAHARSAGEPADRTDLATPRATGRGAAAWWSARYVLGSLGLRDIGEAFRLACLTMLRVVVLIVLASLVWVPIGIWVGLNPKWARGSSR